jgi:hypothetical protein
LKKWLICLVVVATLGLSIYLGVCVYLNSYVPYVPVTWEQGEDFKESPKLNTVEHKKNIRLVLSNYNESWKLENGEVMIKRKMKIGYANKERLWNYTTKANDKEFMRQIKGER